MFYFGVWVLVSSLFFFFFSPRLLAQNIFVQNKQNSPWHREQLSSFLPVTPFLLAAGLTASLLFTLDSVSVRNKDGFSNLCLDNVYFTSHITAISPFWTHWGIDLILSREPSQCPTSVLIFSFLFFTYTDQANFLMFHIQPYYWYALKKRFIFFSICTLSFCSSVSPRSLLGVLPLLCLLGLLYLAFKNTSSLLNFKLQIWTASSVWIIH